MIIDANTKIADILRQHPDALEVIVGLSPTFTKLRNPLLRKVLAGRASIRMASKMGGCTEHDFFTRLKPLGFDINTSAEEPNQKEDPVVRPDFLSGIGADHITELDVRPFIESGNDPLSIILRKIRSLEKEQVLKIVNSFEPTPLMQLLAKQGFESFSEKLEQGLVQTYFYRRSVTEESPAEPENSFAADWDSLLVGFQNRLVTVDVRELEMPLPMHTILEALDALPAEKVLFVYHKRIPVFLLPELRERKFQYRIREVSDSEVQLLIYKD